MNIEDAFAALPPSVPRAGDAATARQLWLRARVAAIVQGDARVGRLRLGGALFTVGALDAVSALLVYAAGAPIAAALAVFAVAHAVGSVTFLPRS